MLIESKLPDIGTNIFTVMSAMARRYDAINLSQGFPDFGIDPELTRLLAKYSADGYNQYAPMPGMPELRNAIAAKIAVMHGIKVDSELELTVTAGATQALYTAIGAAISPGDNVIVFDPAYDCYAPAARSYGGTVSTIALKGPDFEVDWDRVENMVQPTTRMIVINNPHNPLGRTFRDSDMRALEQIAVKHDLLILSDEVYEHLVYDELEHLSALRYPGLRERSLVCFSFGKTFHATGWKTGYCVAPPDLTEEFRRIHQFVTFSVHTPTQLAYAEYMQDANKYLALPVFFQEKRDYFVEQMRKTRFEMLPCEGSYFILADYSAISDQDDREFAEWLTREHGVATIPLSPFYADPPGQKLVRFCFAKSKAVLSEAAERLKF